MDVPVACVRTDARPQASRPATAVEQRGDRKEMRMDDPGDAMIYRHI